MPWWRDDDSPYRRFPESRPRQARGGIRAQSKRGQFGATWWAKRWIGVLESFDIGARLGRGRRYARGGQVLAVQIEKGQVRARVQGSQRKPYEVAIQARVLSSADWTKLTHALARQAIFTAKLLAGEMPQDIEEIFREVGLSLFPERLGDLTTKCSCPDWSNPCKHIAAVYYLLGEEFDRDPFLIFTLRGLNRDELLALMRPAVDPVAAPELAPRTEALATDPSRFWQGGTLPDDFLGDLQAPPVPAGLPRRLGGFPFWRGEAPFLESLEPVYAKASAKGLEAVVGNETIPAPPASH